MFSILYLNTLTFKNLFFFETHTFETDEKNAKTEIVRKTRFADNLPQKKKKNKTFSFLKSVRSRQSSQSNILCRNHSVQISSIRGGTDRLDSLDKAKYVIPRVEYGSRLIKKKGGDSNVSIMVRGFLY